MSNGGSASPNHATERRPAQRHAKHGTPAQTSLATTRFASLVSEGAHQRRTAPVAQVQLAQYHGQHGEHLCEIRVSAQVLTTVCVSSSTCLLSTSLGRRRRFATPWRSPKPLAARNSRGGAAETRLRVVPLRRTMRWRVAEANDLGPTRRPQKASPNRVAPSSARRVAGAGERSRLPSHEARLRCRSSAGVPLRCCAAPPAPSGAAAARCAATSSAALAQRSELRRRLGNELAARQP